MHWLDRFRVFRRFVVLSVLALSVWVYVEVFALIRAGLVASDLMVAAILGPVSLLLGAVANRYIASRAGGEAGGP